MFAARNAFMAGSKSPVSFIGGNGNTIIPAHVAGDLIVIWAGNWGAAPAKPAAGGTVPEWTDIAVTGLGRLCWCIGTGSTTAGSWSLAYAYTTVWRGGSKIGASAVESGSYGLAFPDLTLAEAGGTSAILGLVGVNNAGFSIAYPNTGTFDILVNNQSSTTGNYRFMAGYRVKAKTGTGATGFGNPWIATYPNPPAAAVNLAVEIQA